MERKSPLGIWQRARHRALCWYAWQQRSEATTLCSHSLLLPLCHGVFVSCSRDLFPRFSVLVSSFATPQLPPPFFIASSSINRRRPLPRMLVMCFSNLLWWHFLYLKKKYCGLLGGLTFYRTCHICKRWKKSWRPPFSCTGHVQTQLCTLWTLFTG